MTLVLEQPLIDTKILMIWSGINKQNNIVSVFEIHLFISFPFVVQLCTKMELVWVNIGSKKTIICSQTSCMTIYSMWKMKNNFFKSFLLYFTYAKCVNPQTSNIWQQQLISVTLCYFVFAFSFPDILTSWAVN